MSDICDKRLDIEIVKWVATGPPDSYGRSINAVALAREVLVLRAEIERLHSRLRGKTPAFCDATHPDTECAGWLWYCSLIVGHLGPHRCAGASW